VDGKQVALGVSDPGGEAAALQVLQTLLAKIATTQQQPAADWPSRVEAFLKAKAAVGLCDKTLSDYRKHLTFALAHFGTLPVPDVKAIQESVRPKWGENSRRNYLSAVETFLRWSGLAIHIDKPGRESAGAGMVIAEKTYHMALGAATGDLRPLLAFLWNTGCRPSEATVLTAADVDWASGTITRRKHKTRKGSKGAARVIYLSPPALEILDLQRKLYPAGLLFPNRRGTPWREKALSQAVWRVAKKIQMRVTAYGCRHTYCTRALEKGIPDTHVCRRAHGPRIDTNGPPALLTSEPKRPTAQRRSCQNLIVIKVLSLSVISSRKYL
jgi:integrase